MKISIYPNIFEKVNGVELPILDVLNGIKFGKWNDKVEELRQKLSATTIKKERGELKAAMPYFTASGTFTKAQDKCLKEHSGFIAIDFDDCTNLEEIEAKIRADKYSFSVFRSISNTGLCVLVKINGEKHRTIFKALEEYYADTYGYVIDQSCINVSRARYVSFDPNLYLNEKAKKWTNEKKEVRQKKAYTQTVISDTDNTSRVIKELCDRGVNICESYQDWLRTGFALVSEFGENGRDMFHALSQQSGKYDSANVDKKYDSLIKEGSKDVSIAYIMYHAKNEGIDIRSPKAEIVTNIAKQQKKNRKKPEEVADVIEKMQGIPKEESMPIIEKVYEAKGEIETGNTKIEQLEIYLKSEYNFRRNTISLKIDDGESELDNTFFNSIWVNVQKFVNEKIPFQMVERLIDSHFTPNYNPITDFIEENKHMAPKGNIKKMAECLNTDMDSQYVQKFVKKWLVSIISAIEGNPSPLVLVLTGAKMGTGKTQFFRRLLPKEISNFYAESKLDRGKDDEILMAQRLIVMDDEYGGKSKKDSAKLKELTSKETFTLRAPYGHYNVDMKRLAVLCGTSNENQIINDPIGNRRIIPISIIGELDFEKYNSIDKTELLIEAYHEFKNGYDWSVLREDMKYLNESTEDFKAISMEKDLILSYFSLTEVVGTTKVQMTSTAIKVLLEKNSQQRRLNVNKIGQELKGMGIEKISKRVSGIRQNVYELYLNYDFVNQNHKNEAEAPF